MTNVVIAGYARSPFHLAGKGELARVRPDDLAAQTIRGLLDKTGVDPAEIEDIILGCAFPEGEQGLNVAKLIARSNYEVLTASPEALGNFLASLPVANSPWDECFSQTFCSSCEREDCDTDGCPYQDKRNNPTWWLAQAARGGRTHG